MYRAGANRRAGAPARTVTPASGPASREAFGGDPERSRRLRGIRRLLLSPISRRFFSTEPRHGAGAGNAGVDPDFLHRAVQTRGLHFLPFCRADGPEPQACPGIPFSMRPRARAWACWGIAKARDTQLNATFRGRGARTLRAILQRLGSACGQGLDLTKSLEAPICVHEIRISPKGTCSNLSILWA